MKTLSKLLIVLLFVSCNQENNTVKVTFLQLNDVYEISTLEGGKVGGMARVETIHKQLLAENTNTFMVMAGDFLNPSLIGTLKYKGERIRGKQMIETMNAMNFDLVNFGNHEFDLKYNDLQKRLNESNFKWVSTNALHRIDSTTLKPFYTENNTIKTNIERTYIHEFKNKAGNSLKIGFIAPTINSNPKEYVDYGDFYEDSKNAYNSIKDKCDLVLGLTHLQQNQDEMIAKMLPKIPLIMGGHEHTNRLIPIGNCKIAKADANAKTVYIHRLEYNLKTKKYTITSELIPVNENVATDEKIERIVEKWNVLLDEKIKEILPNPNEVIYLANKPLDGRDTQIRSIQTNLGKIITKGMAFGFENKVDCALVNGGSIRIDDLLEGNITGVDLFRVLPYGGSVLKVKIKGYLLTKVLNYGKLKAGTGAYLQRFKAELDKDGKTWLVSQKPIKATKIYTVAFSDYLLKGLDIPFLKSSNKGVISVYKPKENELNSDIRKSTIAYLKSLKE